jgi:site-specific recombinase XerD
MSGGKDGSDARPLPAGVIDSAVLRASGARTGRASEGPPAPSTRGNRARYWVLFETFCEEYGGLDADGTRRRGLSALPAEPDTVTAFVAYMAHRGYAPATIQACLSVVRARHRIAGLPVPDGVAAAAAVRGYRTELEATGWQPRRSAPARTRELAQLVEVCDLETAQGLRDRALVLLGYSIAATRSALTRLDVEDLHQVDERHYEVSAHQGGREPRQVLVPHWGVPGDDGRCPDPLCPLCATFAWIGRIESEGGVAQGPLLRPVDRNGNIAGVRPIAGGHDERLSLAAVNYILQRLRRRADLPDTVTPHSLRAGFAVESIESGASERDVRRHGGWVPHSTAFTVYTRGLVEEGPSRRSPLLDVARARAGTRATHRGRV